MKGRPRLPAELKVLKGTFRSDRNPKEEPKPPPVYEVRNPPAYIGKFGKELWKDVVEGLVATGVLTQVDWPVLEICCQSYNMYREAVDDIYWTTDMIGRKKKRTLSEYLQEKGTSQKILAIRAMDSAKADFLHFASELGMTPVARNRIDVSGDTKERDPMDDLLEGKEDHA